MKSRMLTCGMCAEWLATASEKDIAFVDEVFDLCERNYDAGGDVIVECYSPAMVLEEFKTLEDVRNCVGLWREQALDARWGDDTDPELRRPDWKN